MSLKIICEKSRSVALYLARLVMPPVIYSLIRRLTGRLPDQASISYQGVVTPMFMTRMHAGNFSEIHEKYALLDLHINSDTNITRLRVYTLCTFAKIAQINVPSGNFLTAGIS
jgi:hypothetical protein